jgi:two-component system, chemotaxis family, sensor kinase CheA
MSEGRDPFKYFRVEARELIDGLNRGVLELEKGAATAETVGRLLRLSHTLKGAARVVKLPTLADHTHAVEDILAPYRTGGSAPGRHEIDRLLELLDAIGAGLAAIEPERAAAPEGAAAPERPVVHEEGFETVRVDLREMDALLEGARGTAVRVHALRQRREEVERARRLTEALVDELEPRRWTEAKGRAAHEVAGQLRAMLHRIERDLGSGIDEASAELVQVRDAASRLRLVEASSVFGLLQRAARDAAQSTQKALDFHVAGGTTRLDAYVLGALRDALIHVVRNAVVHGIEAAPERTASGKPPAGRIEVAVERRGNRVAFVCSDDGRGIDVAALGQAAVRGGLIAEGAPTTAEDAFRMLLRGGLTTTRTVTQLSGRGIGLDVVRATAERLNGEVGVKSEPGRGTRFEIVVPVSLAALMTLGVEAGGVVVALPFDAVVTTLRLGERDVARSGAGETIVHEGKAVPLVALARLLSGASPRPPAGGTGSAVVIAAGKDRAAFAVDRVRGVTQAVVLPLPAHAAIDAVVAGASLDERGSPELVLDPTALVAAARKAPGTAVQAAPKRSPILIIDDSLTTRMLEQSILEAAGYEVDLATSAEDGLGKARRRRYGLFLVDVEMPGMDGFQFVAQTRADPSLRDTPAILVTSLGSPEHRRRGEEAGARGFIAKGEFDQASLLRSIHDLVR